MTETDTGGKKTSQLVLYLVDAAPSDFSRGFDMTAIATSVAVWVGKLVYRKFNLGKTY